MTMMMTAIRIREGIVVALVLVLMALNYNSLIIKVLACDHDRDIFELERQYMLRSFCIYVYMYMFICASICIYAYSCMNVHDRYHDINVIQN